MKAVLRVGLAFVILASIAACAPSVPQELYDEAQSDIGGLTDQVSTLQAYGDEARNSLAERDERIVTLEAEATAFRRELSEARSEASRLETTT